MGVRAGLVILMALAAFAAPATASASTVTRSETLVTVSDRGGETRAYEVTFTFAGGPEGNLVTIDQPGARTYRFADPGSAISPAAGSGCTANGPSAVTCVAPAIVRGEPVIGVFAAADTGAGADSVVGRAGSGPIDLGPGADSGRSEAGYSIDGGPGDDSLSDPTDAKLAGGAGNDLLSGPGGGTLVGGEGDDRLIGSGLADALAGGPGSDSVVAGGGDDVVIDEDGAVGSKDSYDGGPGADFLSFQDTPRRVRIDLRAPNQGGADADSSTGFEHAVGGSAADRMIGTNAPNTLLGGKGSDRISGLRGNDQLSDSGDSADLPPRVGANVLSLAGGGNDRLSGGPGRDRLIASEGRDRLSGGSGRDTLLMRDDSDSRRGSHRAACGPGRDLVRDPRRSDVLGGDCERAQSPDLNLVLGLRPRPRRGSLTFRARCVSDCRGRIVLRSPRGKRRTLGRSRRIRFRDGPTTGVRVVLNSRGRRALARRRGAVVLVSLSGSDPLRFQRRLSVPRR